MSSSWEEVLSDDGRLYYYDRTTGESVWKNPEKVSLPPSESWRKVRDLEGHTYYYNTSTKATTWDQPPEYDEKLEARQELEFRRQNFFRMMSSSIQKNLNPNRHPTPTLHTIKDTSVRFDTDPRLICATDKQRERFIDEWLTLERKRRVILEEKMVENAMQRLKAKMYEMVDAGSFTFDTKWDDIINVFRMNKDWKMLLNFDRLKVFREVKLALHEELMLASASRREQQLGVKARRWLNFPGAMEAFIDKSCFPSYSIIWKTLSAEIERLLNFMELTKNPSGCTESWNCLTRVGCLSRSPKAVLSDG
jgi:hypothetical protein